MSKIEKALQKARGERNLRIVVRSADAEGRQLAPVREGALVSLPEQRAGACQQIALMHEPELRSKGDLEQYGIIYPEMPETGAVKAFREIRTKIVQKTGGRNCTVVVTSVGGQSGTGLVALNLGVAFAFDAGKTALAIDCNLRNPSFHRFLSMQSYKGIKDFLEDPEMDVGEIICPVGIPRLRVIPAGGNAEIPIEYFTSARMAQLIDNIKQRYLERYIILDAPPMSQSADVQILMEMCDYVLLVVPYGRVTEAQIARCVEAINPQKLLGAMFNDAPRLPQLNWREIVTTSPLYLKGASALAAAKNKWRRKV
jgi:capsular exopolysaccharide synthesis family protein